MPEIAQRTILQQARYEELSTQSRVRVLNPTEAAEWITLARLRGLVLPVTPATLVDGAIGFTAAEVAYAHGQVAQVAQVPQVAQVEAPLPVTQRKKITVRISRQAETYRGWTISVEVNGAPLELPSIGVVKGYLQPDSKRFLPTKQGRYRNTYNICRDALESGLSPQALHDALKAWAVAHETAPSEANSETSLDDETAYLLKAQPATLEVGGKVFKLVPAGEIDVRPLISRVRKKALAGARAEAATITSKAKTDARIVVSGAEDKAAVIRAAVEQMKRDLESQLPGWVKDSARAAFWNNHTRLWNVRLMVSCKVKEIRLTVREWNRILYWNAVPIEMNSGLDSDYHQTHKMPLWLQLLPEGRFNLDNVSHGIDGWTTVHTSHRCCMELQNLPTEVKTNRDLVNLETAISRGLQVVNLNSPLSRDWFSFYPDFKAQIPNMVRKWLRQEIMIAPMRRNQTVDEFRAANPTIMWDRAETIEQEAASMFNVETYTPTAVAEGNTATVMPAIPAGRERVR